MNAWIQTSRGELGPDTELELAAELLATETEAELDQFIPLLIGPALAGLKALAPVALKAAAPLLKGLASKALPLIKSAAKQGLQQIGSSLAQRVGQRGRARRGQPQRETEEFLGGILGNLFGGEMEAEDRFLGNILSGLLSGEMEAEETGDAQLDLAIRFVRLSHAAARSAAREIARLSAQGQKPGEGQIRKIVVNALLASARRLAPNLLPEGADIEALASSKPTKSALPAAPSSPRPAPPSASAQPSAGAPPVSDGSPVKGASGRARWVRQGDKIILSF
jgi:hypothetical protein